MDTVMYISGATLIVAVICLIMVNKVLSIVRPAEEGSAPAAAPARAAAPAASAAAPAAPAADNGAVVAAIAAAIVAMGYSAGDVISVRPAKNPRWTTAARLGGVQQF